MDPAAPSAAVSASGSSCGRAGTLAGVRTSAEYGASYGAAEGAFIGLTAGAGLVAQAAGYAIGGAAGVVAGNAAIGEETRLGDLAQGAALGLTAGVAAEIAVGVAVTRAAARSTAAVATEQLGTKGAEVSTTTVGRYMSRAELDAMMSSGKVEESFNLGVTCVTVPPNPTLYRAAPAGDVFTQFDVPTDSLRALGTGTAKIYGPNSIFGPRLGITEMPQATNIVVPP